MAPSFGGLEESGAEGVVDGERGPEDRFRKCLVNDRWHRNLLRFASKERKPIPPIREISVAPPFRPIYP